MSGPDIVEITSTVAVTERRTDVVTVGYTQVTGDSSHSHDPASIGAIPANTVTDKGDILIATGPGAVTRLPAGTDGDVLTVDSSQTVGLKWAAPPSGGGSGGLMEPDVYPLLEGYGFVGASYRPMPSGTSVLGNGVMHFARVWIPAGREIDGLWIAVRTAAGGHDGTSGPNCLAIYDDSGNLIDTTVDDASLWTDVGWRGDLLSGGPIPAQQTGRFVYVSAIARGFSTSPGVSFPTGTNDGDAPWFVSGPTGGNRRSFYLSGQTSVPASFDPTSAGTATTFMPLYGVSGS